MTTYAIFTRNNGTLFGITPAESALDALNSCLDHIAHEAVGQDEAERLYYAYEVTEAEGEQLQAWQEGGADAGAFPLAGRDTVTF